jgi:hypothetical protein
VLDPPTAHAVVTASGSDIPVSKPKRKPAIVASPAPAVPTTWVSKTLE